MKKLTASRGETLVETLAAILVITLTIAALTTVSISAAKINAKIRNTDVSFQYSEEAPTAHSDLTLRGGGTRSGRTAVSLYENNGYLYYTGEDTP